MALSPNYGWSEPDNSSLVKNGAADIRTLGDAIDTSLWNVGFGQAGKNKIINGNFGIWQRGTSINPSVTGTYTADRWLVTFNGTGATRTVSQQTFTPASAPVAGYESQYYCRFDQSVAGSGGTYNQLMQRIEDVRTFAGQTVTLSFWAKASSATSLTLCKAEQNFGSGGSATVNTTFTASQAITTSWVRYSYSVTLPSLSGLTIGTSSFLNIVIGMPLNATFTVDIWGVQLEAGSKATPFQTATGTIQGELAACQRYYYQWTAANAFSPFATGFTSTLSTANLFKPMPVTMRITPTITTTGTAANYGIQNGTNGRVACSAVPSINQGNPDGLNVDFTTAAVLTAGGGITGNANNTTSAYLGFSAEL